jgi:hypothetical protein
VAFPLEATYLPWPDLRAYGVPDPAAAAVRHGLQPATGSNFQPGLEATSGSTSPLHRIA